MSRMRRAWTVVAVALGAAALGLVPAALPAGAGTNFGTLTIRKAVDGTATGGFTVTVACPGDGALFNQVQATLEFDASGTPTTFTDTGGGTWTSAGGAWQLQFMNPVKPTACTTTETGADGATSTSWMCAFDAVLTENSAPQAAGCDAAAGNGIGPVGFSLHYDSTDPDVNVLSQEATVTFTNTIAPEPVELAPAFTG